MNYFRYNYIKLIYFIYKNIYWIVINYSFFFFIYYYLIKIFNYLVFITDEIYYDYYDIKRNFYKKFKLYLNLGLVKHIFLIFFFFAGLIPLLLFISFCFFFTKYIFKYLFLTLDFFINPDDDDEDSNYYKIKYYVMYFFGYVPYIIIKIYKFLFKSRWTRFFLTMFLNYLIKKKNRLIKYFINKIDYFVLVYLPKKYDNLKLINYHNIYVDFMIIFYKIKKKIFVTIPWFIRRFFLRIYKKIYIGIYKNIILRFYRIYFLRRFLAIKLIYLKIEKLYSDIYHYCLYKYKHIKYYLIWLFKVYIWSEACYITIEAYFDLNYLNGKAYIKYIFMHLYYNFCYVIIYKWCELLKLIFKRSYYYNCIYFYLCKLKNRKINDYYLLVWYWYYNYIYNYFILWTSIFIKTQFLIDFNFECYQVDFGDKSQTWWNIKIYDVIALFFIRAYASAPLRYKLRFFKIVYHMRFNWFYGNMYDRVTNGIVMYFWIKRWRLWVWFYNTFLD